jgi:hypothetical protein
VLTITSRTTLTKPRAACGFAHRWTDLQPQVRLSQISAGHCRGRRALRDYARSVEDKRASRRAKVAARKAEAAARLAELRGRAEEIPAGSAALQALRSEHDAGGGLIAGGVAFRFFLWLVPFGLVVASIGSLWGEYDEAGLESAAREFGLGAAAAEAAAESLQTGERNAVIVLVIGFVSLAWFTLGVLRAANISYALAWRLEVPKIHRPLGAIALPNGMLVLAFAASVATAWLREQIVTTAVLGALIATVATTSIALYAMWLLPHRASHPFELLPGAVIVGVGHQYGHGGRPRSGIHLRAETRSRSDDFVGQPRRAPCGLGLGRDVELDVLRRAAVEAPASSARRHRSQGERRAHTKLLYGVGDGTYRGVTVFDAWENGVGRVDIVEIATTGQESWVQLAGTVIHDPLTALTGRSGGVMRCRARTTRR